MQLTSLQLNNASTQRMNEVTPTATVWIFSLPVILIDRLSLCGLKFTLRARDSSMSSDLRASSDERNFNQSRESLLSDKGVYYS